MADKVKTQESAVRRKAPAPKPITPEDTHLASIIERQNQEVAQSGGKFDPSCLQMSNEEPPVLGIDDAPEWCQEMMDRKQWGFVWDTPEGARERIERGWRFVNATTFPRDVKPSMVDTATGGFVRRNGGDMIVLMFTSYERYHQELYGRPFEEHVARLGDTSPSAAAEEVNQRIGSPQAAYETDSSVDPGAIRDGDVRTVSEDTMEEAVVDDDGETRFGKVQTTAPAW